MMKLSPIGVRKISKQPTMHFCGACGEDLTREEVGAVHYSKCRARFQARLEAKITELFWKYRRNKWTALISFLMGAGIVITLYRLGVRS